MKLQLTQKFAPQRETFDGATENVAGNINWKMMKVCGVV